MARASEPDEGAVGSILIVRVCLQIAPPHPACYAGHLLPRGEKDYWSAKDAVYILNTPKRVSGMGAFRLALMARPRTSRVWAGSMTPSSQRRAVA